MTNPNDRGSSLFTSDGPERIWRLHAAVLLPCYLSWTLHFWMSHGALKKNGPSNEMCDWSPMFFWVILKILLWSKYHGLPSCHVYIFGTGISVPLLKLQTYNLFFLDVFCETVIFMSAFTWNLMAIRSQMVGYQLDDFQQVLTLKMGGNHQRSIHRFQSGCLLEFQVFIQLIANHFQ